MSNLEELEGALRRVTKHFGTCNEFKWKLASAARKAAKAGPEGRERYAKHALKMIADERNLLVAMEHLRKFGGWAPGPNGVTFNEYPDVSCRWAQCRDLRDAIMGKKTLVDGEWKREQSYVPGGVRKRKVPKPSGNGSRTIAIQNLEDRIVCRGVKPVLDPILNPIFLANSFGFRSGLDRSDALLRAIESSRSEERWVWVQADIKDDVHSESRGQRFGGKVLAIPAGLVAQAVTDDPKYLGEQVGEV